MRESKGIATITVMDKDGGVHIRFPKNKDGKFQSNFGAYDSIEELINSDKQVKRTNSASLIPLTCSVQMYYQFENIIFKNQKLTKIKFFCSYIL